MDFLLSHINNMSQIVKILQTKNTSKQIDNTDKINLQSLIKYNNKPQADTSTPDMFLPVSRS